MLPNNMTLKAACLKGAKCVNLWFLEIQFPVVSFHKKSCQKKAKHTTADVFDVESKKKDQSH